MTVYILNSPVITSYGVYSYRPIGIEEAKELLSNGFISAIGHEPTAKFLSQILQIQIPVNRVQIKMEPKDKAIVIRLLKRVEEGKVLSEEEIRKIGYELGLLEAHYWACPWCGEAIA
jgi:hypothetical protein